MDVHANAATPTHLPTTFVRRISILIKSYRQTKFQLNMELLKKRLFEKESP